MRLLVIADIDDLHWTHGAGQADVLLSCGDVADQVILEAAEANECRTIFAVKGNHDNDVPFATPIIDLHRQTVEHGGLSFGGMNGAWKYKPRGHFLYEQWEANEILSGFGAVDVFLSHNSPRGIHDKNDQIHHGFDGLLPYIRRAKPKLLIHGHQHVDRETCADGTRVVGVYGCKTIEV